MRRTVAVLATTLMLFASGADGQTIAPVVVEYQGKASGKFQIANGTLYPLSVALEPMSFTVDGEGQPSYRPLEPTTHLRLSETSFRVGAREVHTVFYEADAERLPAWFTVYATVTGAKTATGLQVAMRLPHTVYLLSKLTLARDSVVFVTAVGDSGRIVAEVENRSTAFARVKRVEVHSGTGRKSYAGFPFFPGQRRALRLDWDRPGAPDRIVLGFEKFDVEHPISP